MPMQIDLVCDICGKHVGKAKVTIPLHGLSPGPSSARIGYRMIAVDLDDLERWKNRHTRKKCEAGRSRRFPERVTIRQAKEDDRTVLRQRHLLRRIFDALRKEIANS